MLCQELYQGEQRQDGEHMYGDKDRKVPNKSDEGNEGGSEDEEDSKGGINDEDSKSNIWRHGRRNGRIGKGGNEVEESAEANWMKHTMSSKG